MDQLRGVLSAWAFRSEFAYSWFGETFVVVPPRLRKSLSAEQIRETMQLALRDRLYTDFYCRGGAQPQQVAPPSRSGRFGIFAQRLGLPLQGREGWECGWRLVDPKSWSAGVAHVAVVRNGLTLWIDRERVRHAEEARVDSARSVELLLPRLRPQLSLGYLFALGAKDIADDTPTLVRLYWHLTPSIAAQWLSEAATRLDELGVGHHLKVLDEPGAFVRCDAAVIYLPAPELQKAQPALHALQRRLVAHLHPVVPAWTLRLARGVGAAVDPRSNTSFGQHRCQILAEALLSAHDSGSKAPEPCLDHVVRFALARGVDVAQPYRFIHDDPIALWEDHDA